MEFEARFASEEDCRQYLFQLRWPDGFRCPSCGCGKSWPLRKVLLQCATCGRQTSVTAGTIFQGTRSPLPLWFRAMWWVTTQKTGASALGLQRVLGLNSYETAWTWLHKMRRAMVRPGRDLLAGRVAVDESYLGGLEEGLRGRKLENKALIAVAAPRGWEGYRTDSHEENRGCLGRESVAFREGVHRASQRGAYRRLAGLLGVGEGRLRPRDHSYQRAGEIGVRVDASRPPRRVTAEALAAGYPSGRCESQGIWITTWTSSPSASTAANPEAEANSSIG